MNCVSKVGNHCHTCMHVLFPLAHVSELCYRPQTKLRKGTVFTPVCQSLCSQGGVYLSACWDTPPGQTHPTLPWADTPPADGHCSGRTVRILLECFLVKRWDWCPKWGILDSALVVYHLHRRKSIIASLNLYPDYVIRAEIS